ncbi:hypothetical protein I2492_19600 [Budviciaceae bacterium CWB-B4]|uniref:Uncharacterized protein n=1 Tax=Limnobaculum xujianqingii TaxID=2738837 RepID=A0A9D7AM97_9GAMM|nr:hypothetical protein [Limnobaculum xujianqingii]MBK5075193.1 hypothetical protein [Limnobaculum xujianqingii]MBK5178513.1 hypothetical protein [Limnobaculum xujianqingii]
MNVSLGKVFAKELRNYPPEDRLKILGFIAHVKEHSFHGLEGRNKESHHVDRNDPDFIVKVKFAIDNNLWHYHIGIVMYDMSKPFGDRTSEYVLHYMMASSQNTKIVDLSAHPPFRFPSSSYLD